MRYLVTGAAGFIGSHLCERLLGLGHEVVGLDCFVPYYPKPLKERNLTEAKKHPRFRFLSLDLRTDDVKPAVDGVDVVYHLAAMPGLVASWTDFDLYLGCNVTATQRLLEAVKGSKSLKRFVYGSTSSVYGGTKLACLMFAFELHRRATMAGSKLTSVAAHPGICRTPIAAGWDQENRHSVRDRLERFGYHASMRLFGRSAAEGARSIVHAGTESGVVGGGYYGPTGFGQAAGRSRTQQHRRLAEHQRGIFDEDRIGKLLQRLEHRHVHARVAQGVDVRGMLG